MSEDKSKTADKASEVAKSIWLAGVGAYGKAFHEAQEGLQKAGKETPRLFKELLKKGSHLEEEARESFDNLFGRSEEMTEMNAKLDALSEKMDGLISALDKTATKPKRKAAPGQAAPRKKAAAKKKTSTTTTRAAKKKS